MTSFYGDYDTTETVYIPFNTFDSNDPSASVTATTLLNTDCHVHKDGAIAQRTSSAGETLSIDFDGVTGNHLLALDLSNNDDAGFYAAGSTYQVRIEGATVDTANINAWIGAFSIGRTLRPTTAGRTLDVSTTGEAGVDWANVGSPTTAVNLSATNIDVDQVVASVSGAVGSVTGAVGSVTGSVGSVTGAVGSVTGAVGSISGVTFPTNFGDLAITASAGTVLLKAATHTGAVIPTVSTLTDHTAQTGDSFAIVNGAAGLVAIDTVVDAILEDTATTIPTAVGLKSTQFSVNQLSTDVTELLTLLGTPAGGTIASDIATAQTDLDTLTGTDGATLATAQGNYAPATVAALATVDGNVDANKVILDALTAAGAAQLALSAAGIIGGVAQTGTLTTEIMTSDLSGYADNELIGRTIIWTGGTADGQASDITDYASASGTVTYTAITNAPANADTFVIV